MNEQDRLRFVLEVLEAFSITTADDYQTLFWRTDGEYAPVSFWANCSDLFAWGGTDCEPLANFEDLELFKTCDKEIKATGEFYGAAELYACRKRKMRPQGACYKHYKPVLWPLFDACGPPREVGIGNPKEHPSGQIPRHP